MRRAGPEMLVLRVTCFVLLFSRWHTPLFLQLCMALSKCIKLKWAFKEAFLLCRLFKNVLIMLFTSCAPLGKRDDQLRRQNEHFFAFSKILNCLGGIPVKQVQGVDKEIFPVSVESKVTLQKKIT